MAATDTSVISANGTGFAVVDYIISLARKRSNAPRFVFYRYHTHTVVLFELTGLWPAYEEWKREIVRRAR
jgi:hypothetical protein